MLDKLLTFHRERGTLPVDILRDLRQATTQIPQEDRTAEARPLQEIYRKAQRSRRAGPQAIGDILLPVLAKLGVDQIQSETEAPRPDAPVSGEGTR